MTYKTWTDGWTTDCNIMPTAIDAVAVINQKHVSVPIILYAAASSVTLSSDHQRALLVDFSCAVHLSTVIADDLVDVIREVLPPHVISPEVQQQHTS